MFEISPRFYGLSDWPGRYTVNPAWHYTPTIAEWFWNCQAVFDKTPSATISGGGILCTGQSDISPGFLLLAMWR